ncbi:phosphatidylserine synthase [Vibrio breoganii]|uniref:Phosphatidylserine synthase n=2 Tax=Vibrio TaxID=662 RepID=A0AAN0XWN9_9VIBR|nr:CDP-diacylglycerol--serine O-phosphatidyltransferase [Vibrio breoganii]ANO33971.1 phosphatidylserine synthase [Vibrio breoganii]MDN3716934.1 CDP-diacylglycerol--serine O-phosphatidyltransferase [Vibrio breoganii]PMG78724.1 phosphatidylserine synthase [Vibrio breoganii]PMK37913.1 phosphatidylserine synthase [Vibrio breoganii]PMK99867.1 phosphatidylserine synthase [Vibrio breoganii]
MVLAKNVIDGLEAVPVDPKDFRTLYSAKEFKAQLLELIKTAKKRIYIAALYLEDDEAGREVFGEIYKAKQANPGLDVQICVDWHRAQRGLIGAESSDGNAAMYTKMAESHKHTVPVYGVPVRGKEVFGVLHLKGFIFDDTVLYSGASINNIYLHQQEKYRFDRYHLINSPAIADAMANYIMDALIKNPAVNTLTEKERPATKSLKGAIRQLRASLAVTNYRFDCADVTEDKIAITPIVGVGKRRNLLNMAIVQLLRDAKDEITICTPYFNFPKSVAKELKKALRRGVKVTVVVGDKTANDFFIDPEEEFKTVGGLPYLYEMNLRRFLKANEANIACRKLDILLWKHDANSYHLKGLWVDKQNMLLTGNNLNPRAWKLDLENALLIRDPQGYLKSQFEQEFENIIENTQRIGSYKHIEKIEHYPEAVQKLLRKITRVQADRVLKQLL